MEAKHTWHGTQLMLLAMGLSGTIGWFVLQSGQPVWNVVFVRCVLGGLGLAAYVVWQRGWEAWPFTMRTLLWCVLGGLALVGNWLLLFAAYRYSSIGMATVLYHTQPFWLLLLGRACGLAQLTARKWLALLLAFGGLLMIVQPGGQYASLTGIVLALGAAVLYAVATLVSKQLPAALHPAQIASVQTLTGALLLWPLLDGGRLWLPGAHWPYLLVLGLIHTTLMYSLLYAAFRTLPTHLIGLLGFVYPVVALLVDYLAYGHALGGLQLLGVGVIVAANLWGLRTPGVPTVKAAA